MEVDDHGQREHPRYFPPPHRHQFSSVPPSCQTLYDPRDCTDSQSFSIRVFSSQSVLRIRWPKYWDFSCSISPSNEYSGLIYFRMDWLDLSVQSQESSPTAQFKSIDSSTLSFLCSPTLTSIHDYWKNHSFDYTDFVSQEISLLFNMLSRLVIPFLPSSKHSFNFMAAVTICSDFGAQENKEIRKS